MIESTVDPWTATPVAVGRTMTILEAGGTVHADVDLVRPRCGNGLIEPGEACDGTPGCDLSSCSIPVTVITEVPGDEPDDIRILAGSAGATLIWLDGSCGTGPASCASWTTTPSDLSSNSAITHMEVGQTTGSLGSDGTGRVGWISVGSAPGSEGEVQILSPSAGGSISTLGPTDSSALDSLPLAWHEGSMTVYGLAVSPELGRLELRWPPGGAATAATITSEEMIRFPAVATFEFEGELGIVALWMQDGTAGDGPGWFLRRWRCDAGPAPCPPQPLDTTPIALESWSTEAAPRILFSCPSAGGGGAAFCVLATQGRDMLLYEIGVDASYPAEPSLRIPVFPSEGFTLTDAVWDAYSSVILALVSTPVAGVDRCRTRLFEVSRTTGSGPEPVVEVGAWGNGGDLGCSASVAAIQAGRYIVAWRTASGAPGTIAVSWAAGGLPMSFH